MRVVGLPGHVMLGWLDPEHQKGGHLEKFKGGANNNKVIK